MTYLLNHDLKLDDGTHLATIITASPAVVKKVLGTDAGDPDGRSQFVWVTLANGDLILGVFPQGDTYEEVQQLVNEQTK